MGAFRCDRKLDLAGSDRDGPRQDLGRSEPRKAGQGLRHSPARIAVGRRAPGHVALLGCGWLDHRAGDQHQWRIQYGLGDTAMMDVDLIAPIARLMNRHVKNRPEQTAYSDSVRSVTYRQLADNTAALAANP